MELNEKIVQLLKRNNLKISTSESVTGGKIISYLIEVPGASNITEQSFVVYSNPAKIKVLGIQKEQIDQYGVVSKEIALEMARNTLAMTNADVIISTTGEAGPIVNDVGINIGTVCFGLIINNKEFSYKEEFSGDRLNIINRAVQFILGELITKIS